MKLHGWFMCCACPAPACLHSVGCSVLFNSCRIQRSPSCRQNKSGSYIDGAGSDGAGSLMGADAMDSPGPGAGAGARPGAPLAAAYKVRCVSWSVLAHMYSSLGNTVMDMSDKRLFSQLVCSNKKASACFSTQNNKLTVTQHRICWQRLLSLTQNRTGSFVALTSTSDDA